MLIRQREKNMFDFRVISGEQVHQIIQENHNIIMDIIADTYISHHKGDSINIHSSFLKFSHKPNARIIALPAYLGSSINLAGIKWISSFPDNIQKGIPRASAILILNDSETGYPIACLESSIISAARTAASAVLGATKLNHDCKEMSSISFIGNGIIARYIFDFFISQGWHFDEAYLFDINKAYSNKFAAYITSNTEIITKICDTQEESCRKGKIIILATTTSEPYIKNRSIFDHNPIILNISLRDLDPDIIDEGFNIVDDVEHCLRASTSLHLLAMKKGNNDFIKGTIGGVLAGDNFISKESNLKIYSPFGLGILDVALGAHVYTRAKEKHCGLEINDFFYEKNRW